MTTETKTDTKKTKKLFDPAALASGMRSITPAPHEDDSLTAKLARTQAALSITSEPEPTVTAPAKKITKARPTVAIPAGASPAFQRFCEQHEYTPGKTIEWELALIDANPYQPRVFYDAGEGLTASAATIGIKESIKVTIHPTDPTRLIQVDGERRSRVARQRGQTHVMVTIEDFKPPLEHYLTGYELNTQRKEQTVLDNAVVWAQLIADKVVASQQDLADRVRVTKSEMSMTLSIAKIPQALLAEMATHAKTFALSMAYEVFRYFEKFGETATLKLIQEIVEPGLTLSNVRDRLRDSRSVQTRPRYDERVVFKRGSEQFGQLKRYGDGRLELSLKGLHRDARDLLFAKMQALVAAIEGTTTVEGQP